MEKIKAVVIDDELSNRQLIVQLISDMDERISVIGEANSVDTGYKLISATKPDVVFLDIKMGDGTGFTLLSLFEEINFEVVFITGFDNYAINAFEFSALDYVLKPVDPHKFLKTLAKVVKAVFEKDLTRRNLKKALEFYNPESLLISRIPIHFGTKVHIVAIDDLLHVRSEDNCTVFKTSEEKFISSKQLVDFEFILDKHPRMIKVNRGIYVNINFIKSYSKGNPCFIDMKDGSTFEVSRRKKTEVLA